jgi:hypothetical protein
VGHQAAIIAGIKQSRALWILVGPSTWVDCAPGKSLWSHDYPRKLRAWKSILYESLMMLHFIKYITQHASSNLRLYATYKWHRWDIFLVTLSRKKKLVSNILKFPFSLSKYWCCDRKSKNNCSIPKFWSIRVQKSCMVLVEAVFRWKWGWWFIRMVKLIETIFLLRILRHLQTKLKASCSCSFVTERLEKMRVWLHSSKGCYSICQVVLFLNQKSVCSKFGEMLFFAAHLGIKMWINRWSPK